MIKTKISKDQLIRIITYYQMKKALVIVWLFMCFTIQSQSEFEVEYQRSYEENIKKDFINDVYIPKNFEEAFEELKRLSETESLAKFKDAEEEIVAKKLHFGLGRWMAVKWNFEEGSRISNEMKELGVTFPDDMVQLMIVSFHRYLNSAPLLIEHQAQIFNEKRKKENEERLKIGITTTLEE